MTAVTYVHQHRSDRRPLLVKHDLGLTLINIKIKYQSFGIGGASSPKLLEHFRPSSRLENDRCSTTCCRNPLKGTQPKGQINVVFVRSGCGETAVINPLPAATAPKTSQKEPSPSGAVSAASERANHHALREAPAVP